jgi:hypothetical protein
MDGCRYFGSDGELNVKERLLYLFPMLHRAPKDGGVSCGELEAWLRRQAADRLDAVARRELKRHDKDGDGVVTLREYLAVDHDQHIGTDNCNFSVSVCTVFVDASPRFKHVICSPQRHPTTRRRKGGKCTE